MTVTAKRHTDLIVWQKAMELVEEVYKMTKAFPKEELYGLTSQLRRSVVSVPSNLAEGHSRRGSREFMHRVSIAHGSLSEVETQIEIAFRLAYITDVQRTQIFALSAETGRIINGVFQSLEKHAAAH
jgi:four helix bundle protein